MLMGRPQFLPSRRACPKTHTCQSLSTTEAETLSAVHGAKKLVYPALDFWEKVFGECIKTDMLQDNQATMRVLQTGKAPTLRRFPCAHGVSLKWIFNAVKDHANLCGCNTDGMAADIFAKHFINEERWVAACKLIGIVSPKKWKVISEVKQSKQSRSKNSYESNSMPSPNQLKEACSQL